MRILILHKELPFPADNGGKLRAAHMAKYLAAHHEAILLSFASPNNKTTPAQVASELKPFASYHEVPLPKPAGLMKKLFSGVPGEVLELSSDAMRQTITELVSRHAPDVIVVSEPAFSQYLGQLPGRVLMLDYLMAIPLSLQRLASISTGWRRWLWHLRWKRSVAYHKQIASVYDLCLVNSQEDYDDLRHHCDRWRRIEFLPNGLILDEYPLGLAEPNPNVLIYPGSVTYLPNRDAVEYMAHEILPLIRAEFPEVQLVVTGAVPADGSEPKATGVVYTGRVADVRPVIAGGWVCVVPLRSGAGGTRFKVLEAMALSTPVVSTTIGAEGVDWTDGENILIGDTAKRFAEQTLTLLRDRQRRFAVAEAGRKLIEQRYDWEVLGRKVTEMLTELVARR